jgi:hypothetical protein
MVCVIPLGGEKSRCQNKSEWKLFLFQFSDNIENLLELSYFIPVTGYNIKETLKEKTKLFLTFQVKMVKIKVARLLLNQKMTRMIVSQV